MFEMLTDYYLRQSKGYRQLDEAETDSSEQFDDPQTESYLGFCGRWNALRPRFEFHQETKCCENPSYAQLQFIRLAAI
jgi:hypothetical protein